MVCQRVSVKRPAFLRVQQTALEAGNQPKNLKKEKKRKHVVISRTVTVKFVIPHTSFQAQLGRSILRVPAIFFFGGSSGGTQPPPPFNQTAKGPVFHRGHFRCPSLTSSNPKAPASVGGLLRSLGNGSSLVLCGHVELPPPPPDAWGYWGCLRWAVWPPRMVGLDRGLISLQQCFEVVSQFSYPKAEM